MAAIRFEHAKADPCVFRKVVDGEAEMVVVAHVDNILAHAKDQATMDSFTAELGQKFKLKDMGDAGYYMGCHVTRKRKARELKLDQHLYVESMVKGLTSRRQLGYRLHRGCRRSQRRTNRGTQTKGGNEEVPVPGGSGGAYVDGDDDPAGHCVRCTRCGQVLRKPWAGA